MKKQTQTLRWDYFCTERDLKVFVYLLLLSTKSVILITISIWLTIFSFEQTEIRYDEASHSLIASLELSIFSQNTSSDEQGTNVQPIRSSKLWTILIKIRRQNWLRTVNMVSIWSGRIEYKCAPGHLNEALSFLFFQGRHWTLVNDLSTAPNIYLLVYCTFKQRWTPWPLTTVVKYCFEDDHRLWWLIPSGGDNLSMHSWLIQFGQWLIGVTQPPFVYLELPCPMSFLRPDRVWWPSS